MVLTVSELYCYPVKSLGALSLERALIDRFGFEHDRRWMVVDMQGKFITQRQCAEMVHIQVQRVADRWRMIDHEGASVYFSEQDFSAARGAKVSVWRDTVAAWGATEDLDQWLSERLKRKCRLVYMPESTQRLVDTAYAKHQETVSFADGFPLLLTTQASLQDFNQHLSGPIEMLRFRPNLVIDGCAPWAEDAWRVIKIGGLLFDVVKPCSRCAIPTINRQTAQKEPAVFKALKQYRQKNGDVFFGQNLLPRGLGEIEVGDRVDVLE